MKKIELLAPAGNMKCLKAAIEAGCDAVYLAGKLFGARAFAGNFNDEELIEAIKYCHLYGVKVYLTVNTIIYENEVEKFINYIRFVHMNNIDAVIIQDLGMFDLIRKKFPNLEVHASTQMHIHNYEGALLAKNLGFKRIVIARETNVETIKKIKDNIDIEVECFIHGALCVSYSGQCLMSSLIGQRSGNRGTCSQCCRMKYDLLDEKGNKLNKDNYLLSMKDLLTIYDIDKIIETNCDSLKIEGRNKSPYYVYGVVKLYRKTIDNYYKYNKVIVDEEDMLNLKKIFNRKYTKGFILNENNNNITNEQRPNHQGVKVGSVLSKNKDELKIKLIDNINIHDGLRILDKKEDKGILLNKMFINKKEVKEAKSGDIITIKYDKFVLKDSSVLKTSDYNLERKIDKKILSKERKVLINIDFKIINNKLNLKVSDGINEVKVKSNKIIEKAVNNPTTNEQIIKQLSKLGDTIYKIKNINIKMDKDIFINIKDINELRRKALNLLNEKRLYKIPFVENEYYFNVRNFEKVNKMSILTDSNIKGYDEAYTNDKELALKNNYILKIPRVVNNYQDYNKKVLIGELGSILKYNNFYTDFSFNVVNSYSVCFLHELGSKKVTLSPELTITQIKNIIESYKKRYNCHPNLEVINKSNVEAMICKFDLNKRYNIKIGYLKDSYNNKYKIISSKDYMTIYDYKKNDYDNNELYKIGVNYIRNIK